MPHLGRSLIAILCGLCAGIGAYTFVYAKGYSYLSNDPAACANCHVMRDYFDSWQKASHHGHAACNDCHTPHSIVPKYFAKAENGWNHSLKFTLDNYPEPIRIRRVNDERLEANCIRCHESMVSEMSGNRCLHCHQHAGHGI